MPEEPLLYGHDGPSRSMASTIPEFYDRGPEIKRKMVELIESAADYIFIDSFLLSADSVTAEVLEALKVARQAGVRIHVLADSSSRYLPGGDEAYEFFEEAKIPCTEYNPMRLYKLAIAPVMLMRDHRKFWIIDGRVLFLGGANLFSTSLLAPEEGGNLDFMVAVECADAVAAMTESFIETWNESSSLPLDLRDFEVRAPDHVETILWLSDQNKQAGRRDVVAQMFEGLFAVAVKEVWLIQPYTFVTLDLLDQIRGLTDRNVEVHVMLSDEVQSPRFHYASFYGIKSLLEAGGKVWVYKAGKGPLHAKAIVVDGRWASIGSANFNARSYHLSKEANLTFGDEQSVGKVVRVLGELRENCREVSLDESKNYRGPEYYVAWLLMQLAG